MGQNSTSPRTIRLLTAILLVGMFAAGVVTGGGLSWWLTAPPQFPHPPRFLGPFSELGLSKQQELKVQRIIEKHRPELEAILHETSPKVRVVFDAIDKEVRALLSPEQQKKLDQIKARLPFPPPGLPRSGPPSGGPPFPGSFPPGSLPPPGAPVEPFLQNRPPQP